MIKQIDNVFSLLRPSAEISELPLVFDSPHSGTIYPMNSSITAPAYALKTTWDAYVDELWCAAPRAGAALLAARFPRAYLDVNRSPQDIDVEMLDGPWTGEVERSAACMRGMGLIRRYALPAVPMYAAPLPISEVVHRIQRYYEPYHAMLTQLLDQAYEKFGQVWHINCHSMKSVGNAMNEDKGESRPDMVVSDCCGTSADPKFTVWVTHTLERLGYSVKINTPYQGGYIVKQYGQPTLQRNSVQIEINRRIYMNEVTFEKTPGFDRLQRDLESFTTELASYVEEMMKVRSLNGVSPL
ncbi:N-formylglutamate amidohydrolase [Herbaspirillum sp. GCM10030257]|uniref:N-formylglutamate amidohydrolase n=1 Tax=Herbaspirillum sp. GCM10030257 TaxID=3273393 RepID=UPI003611AFD4